MNTLSKRVNKSVFFVAFSVFFSMLVPVSTLYAADVKNETARQVGNRVVFGYDLTGKEKEADVTITLEINGKKYRAKDLHLEGDFGKVGPGKGKKIYWNVLQDFPRGLHGRFVADIEASGGFTWEMVFVKGGCFDMGDTFGDGYSNEKPVHEVCVDDFYMGRYEVTQKEWEAVMGGNPSYFDGCGNCPVEQVAWHDIQEFIRKLSRKRGRIYRLPTEAEWEYAARGRGRRSRWAGTSDESALGEYAWYSGNSGGRTHPVGHKKPNAIGLYDMTGNVWEWVSDRYGEDYYEESLRNNPKGPSGGSDRVWRGGSWYNGPGLVSATHRFVSSPSYMDSYTGFRLVVDDYPRRQLCCLTFFTFWCSLSLASTQSHERTGDAPSMRS